MSATRSSPLLRILRWIAKWIGIAIIALIVLIILGYVEEDIRGAHDWATTKKELEAKGEVLELAKFRSNAKPEDDLSKIPIFAEIYRLASPGSHLISSSGMPAMEILDSQEYRLGHISETLETKKLDKWPDRPTLGNPTDLSAWQAFYRSIPESHLGKETGTPAEDVLAVLKKFDADLNELESAVKNPDGYWPVVPPPFVSYHGLHVLNAKRYVSRVLMLRAAAELSLGRSDLAKKDYFFCLTLARAGSRFENYLEYIMGASVQEIGAQIVWDGIHDHKWTDSDLREIDHAIFAEDMLRRGLKALRYHRAMVLSEAEYWQRHPSPGWYRLFPSGWWEEHRRRRSREIQKDIDALDIKQRVVLDPKTDKEIARAETEQRFVSLACKLEQFYLAKGHYPDALVELSPLPDHLNADVWTGKPLHYHRERDSYLLYSVGPDGTDHGGVPRSPPYEKNGVSNHQDEWDWVRPGP